MIPSNSNDLTVDFEEIVDPSHTYNLIIDKNRCIGYTDNVRAMEQAIFLMLSIERYDHIIYSWDFGVEFRDLFGQPTSYVASEVKRRIEEALLRDDRINGVSGFVVTSSKHKVHVSFTAHTIFGDIQAEKEVNY